MNLKIERFAPGNRDDFFKVHCEKNGGGWCYCVAWWVETWDGWGQRTEADNRRLRVKLLDEGHYDGYLLCEDNSPIGWCQVGRRDRLKKLVRQFDLKPDFNTWAVTCFFIAAERRRKGLASFMLKEIMADLRNRGIKKVEAFPRHDDSTSEDDLWTGPRQMYLEAGFEELDIDNNKSIYAIEL
ncbi:MAG: GNAT family N-acetyltransferase [candidate division Zixibacteria bacterium]|nr:GNAT family N-acetyltransferase [candidate division Zixibacteria bacterium]